MKLIHSAFSLLALLIFSNVALGQISANDFVTSWSNDSVVIPVSPNYNYNYDVDWDNDGVFDDFGVTGRISHKISALPPFSIYYQVRIRGTFPAIVFSDSMVVNNIREVNQWGSTGLQDFAYAFKDCNYVEIFATDSPVFDSTVNISCEGAFEYVSILLGPFNNWNMSSVTNLKRMFYQCQIPQFTGGLNNWDVSSVTNMDSMFYGVTVFNGDLNNWDVSNVTSMSSMFESADYAGDISTWDVSSVIDMSEMFKLKTNLSNTFNVDVSSWDVSSVKDMSEMFAFNYNAPGIDIASWDVSSVENMNGMLIGCDGFDQNLGNWQIDSVTDMSNMFNNTGMSIANYDSTLIGWANQVHQSNVNLGALNLEYCSAINARNQLITDGWTISGDMTNCVTSIKEFDIDKVNIYPNPTSGILKMEGVNFQADIEVFSIEGKLLQQALLQNGQVDLTGLPSGFYLIKVGDSAKKVFLK